MESEEEQRRLAEEQEKRLQEEAARQEEEKRIAEENRKEEERRAEEERRNAEEHKCAYCIHLDEEKKSEGRYYCSKVGTYIKADDSNKKWGCGSYEESTRSTYESDLLLNDSESLTNHTESMLGNHYCCDCNFFDPDKKAGEGCYKCTKRNQDRMADEQECYMFESSGRSSRENEKMYDEAKEARKKSGKQVDGSSTFALAIVAILLVLGAIIVNVFFN